MCFFPLKFLREYFVWISIFRRVCEVRRLSHLLCIIICARFFFSSLQIDYYILSWFSPFPFMYNICIECICFSSSIIVRCHVLVNSTKHFVDSLLVLLLLLWFILFPPYSFISFIDLASISCMLIAYIPISSCLETNFKNMWSKIYMTRFYSIKKYEKWSLCKTFTIQIIVSQQFSIFRFLWKILLIFANVVSVLSYFLLCCCCFFFVLFFSWFFTFLGFILLEMCVFWFASAFSSVFTVQIPSKFIFIEIEICVFALFSILLCVFFSLVFYYICICIPFDKLCTQIVIIYEWFLVYYCSFLLYNIFLPGRLALFVYWSYLWQ